MEYNNGSFTKNSSFKNELRRYKKCFGEKNTSSCFFDENPRHFFKSVKCIIRIENKNLLDLKIESFILACKQKFKFEQNPKDKIVDFSE